MPDLLADPPKERSPEWWVARLSEKIRGRQRGLQKARDYYEGKHRLAFATRKFEEAFGGLFKEFADNWCGVVVQAPSERLEVQGIRIAQGEDAVLSPRGRLGSAEDHDTDAWAMWQRNELDADSATNHTEALSTGYGYVLVWRDPDDEPLITVEDPLQWVVAYEPGIRIRAAALKLWKDDWTDRYHATLYLPDGLYKFQSQQKDVDRSTPMKDIRWEKREVDGEHWPLNNPLKVVPVVEFANDPTVRREGRSEILRVIPVQNAVNKIIADMMVASEFVAFPQRAILGWTPDEDSESPGEPSARELQMAASRIWTFGDKEVSLEEWSQANLQGHVELVEMFVHHIAAQSRTPRHYFVRKGQEASGDAIKSAETGLVAKVGERMVHYGERWEEVIRLGFAVKGDPRAKATASEIIWKDPEFRTEGELTDAIIKQHQAGLIPWRVALERLGYSPQEIDRMERLRMRDTLMVGAVKLGDLTEDEEPEAAEGEPAAATT